MGVYATSGSKSFQQRLCVRQKILVRFDTLLLFKFEECQPSQDPDRLQLQMLRAWDHLEVTTACQVLVYGVTANNLSSWQTSLADFSSDHWRMAPLLSTRRLCLSRPVAEIE